MNILNTELYCQESEMKKGRDGKEMTGKGIGKKIGKERQENRREEKRMEKK